MKRLICGLLLVLLAVTLSGCGTEGEYAGTVKIYYVNGDADTARYHLTKDEKIPKAAKGFDVIVVIEGTDYEIETSAEDRLDVYLTRDVVLVEIDPDKKETCIITRGTAAKALSGGQCRTIADNTVPALINGDVDGAWTGAVKEIYKAAEGKALSPNVLQITVSIVTALLFGLLLNVILLRYLSSKQKSMVENVTKAPVGKAKFLRGKTDVRLRYDNSGLDETLIGTVWNFFRD